MHYALPCLGVAERDFDIILVIINNSCLFAYCFAGKIEALVRWIELCMHVLFHAAAIDWGLVGLKTHLWILLVKIHWLTYQCYLHPLPYLVVPWVAPDLSNFQSFSRKVPN
jgi:hypothetical protein